MSTVEPEWQLDGAEEVICEECGNDLAAYGCRFCTECLEHLFPTPVDS